MVASVRPRRRVYARVVPPATVSRGALAPRRTRAPMRLRTAPPEHRHAVRPRQPDATYIAHAYDERQCDTGEAVINSPPPATPAAPRYSSSPARPTYVQAERVLAFVRAPGQGVTYRSFPEMSQPAASPAPRGLCTDTVLEWSKGLPSACRGPAPGRRYSPGTGAREPGTSGARAARTSGASPRPATKPPPLRTARPSLQARPIAAPRARAGSAPAPRAARR